ncbi:MAG: YitT family protein [Peptoniphilus sp.]|nr:YitT family protein [Peptoniphilus sp.]MDD7362604.1 YitT family protein [Bacillota bacterium]MDY6044997.1 YitT family protein [Peptoniphilus sp.]
MLSGILRRLELTKTEFFKIVLGCAIMAFGVVNIHEPSRITEGGVLGLGLLLKKVFGLNLAYVSPILDIACYALGFSMLGKRFLKKSTVATVMFAAFYFAFNRMGPVLPSFYDVPFIAAIAGGIFIGAGCGIAVTAGGCAGGDDALAMVISKKLKWPISRAYLFTDFVVLGLSLTYIPPSRLIFSFMTTVVSSYLIGQFEVKMKKPAWQVSQGGIEKNA